MVHEKPNKIKKRNQNNLTEGKRNETIEREVKWWSARRKAKAKSNDARKHMFLFHPKDESFVTLPLDTTFWYMIDTFSVILLVYVH